MKATTVAMKAMKTTTKAKTKAMKAMKATKKATKTKTTKAMQATKKAKEKKKVTTKMRVAATESGHYSDAESFYDPESSYP
jgi:hypothetical protein